MSSKKYGSDKANPFGDEGDSPQSPPTLAEIDALVYGGGVSGINIPKTDKRIHAPIDIMSIKPDLAQPRRVVPMAIRKGWAGDARGAGDVLARWSDECEKLTGEVINLRNRLEQVGEGTDSEGLHPIVDEYLALVALAGSIHRDGLVNPITVIAQKDGYLIEGGERRWWAYQMLNMVFDDKYATIPAVKVDGKDAIWRQAAENGVRRPLNAVSTARQLALLIMDMWRGRDGVVFNDYGFFDHDQKFYAQVKNGQAFSILKGRMERVLAVTGLKSKAQVAHYRALLNIPAEIWDDADMQNWTEGRIREVMQVAKQPERFTTVNLSTPNEPKLSPFQAGGGGQIGLKNETYHNPNPTPPPPAPKPSPLQYRPAPVELHEDDDVMMDDDGGEPIINRPFADGFNADMRPSDLPIVNMDTRYVEAGTLLHKFITAMVVWCNDTGRDGSDWVTIRDFSPDKLAAAKKVYSPDELEQMMKNWQALLRDTMKVIDMQMADILEVIWSEVGNE